MEYVDFTFPTFAHVPSMANQFHEDCHICVYKWRHHKVAIACMQNTRRGNGKQLVCIRHQGIMADWQYLDISVFTSVLLAKALVPQRLIAAMANSRVSCTAVNSCNASMSR